MPNEKQESAVRFLEDALAWFAAHGVVNHSKDEYVSKDGTVHIQSAEAFFAIFKRGVMGSFHSVSEQHLDRYVDEFAFRWNTRSALGIRGHGARYAGDQRRGW